MMFTLYWKIIVNINGVNIAELMRSRRVNNSNLLIEL